MRAALDRNGADAYWAGRFGLIPLRRRQGQRARQVTLPNYSWRGVMCPRPPSRPPFTFTPQPPPPLQPPAAYDRLPFSFLLPNPPVAPQAGGVDGGGVNGAKGLLESSVQGTEVAACL